MSKNNKPGRRISCTALGMSIGLIFGGIVSLVIDNLVIFAGGGLKVGLAIGSALDNHRLEDDS